MFNLQCNRHISANLNKIPWDLCHVLNLSEESNSKLPSNAQNDN
ncbi:hypothetical protein BN1221_04700c [Brenneria goodwinii]|uniref:Uncharacterized protein n=1 Tax=Brenneria goodwinii TaxID=1109412 RepID=A0A0G4K248_9GAMM|nr:hypothetical protein BN1221_04700c [Brenneria goodwinii]